MASPPIEERVSRIEGGYDHLATKADLERLRADVEGVRADVERLRADVARWMFQFGIAVVGANITAIGVGVAILRLTG